MVAFMSMLMAKDNGFQSAMMAPTAILKELASQKTQRLCGKAGYEGNLIKAANAKKRVPPYWKNWLLGNLSL